jgi:hypothetical protein
MLRRISNTKSALSKARSYRRENHIVVRSNTSSSSSNNGRIIYRLRQNVNFYNIYNKKANHDSRRDQSSFNRIRACYFSNVLQGSDNNTHDETSIDKDIDGDDDDDNDDEDDHISTRLGATSLPTEDPNKYKFRYNLNSFYFTHHGETGGSIKDAFATEMIKNPNKIIVEQVDDHTAENSKHSSIDILKQLWTATLTCPVTNERFEAGRLPGYFDVNGRNYYSKKSVALEAVSAVALSHKIPKNDNDDENENGCTGGDDNQCLTEETEGSIPDRDTFRQILQRMYMKHFKVRPSSRQSKIIKQDFVGKTKGGTWWTSEFTCPVTGRIYESSDLTGQGDSDFMLMNESGRVWYRKKSDSVHAAAYTAIESVNWDDGELLLEEGELSSIAPYSVVEDESNDADNDSFEILMHPLIFWYAEHRNTKIAIEDNFVVTGSDVGRNKWTASFLCPLTGERFDSGTLNSNAIHSADENVKWYTQKDTAMQAAALRAYDVFKYRETGSIDPRFCREDSADFDTQTSLMVATSEQDHDGDRVDESTFDSILKQNEFTAHDEDNEDDYVIELIPQQINLAQGLDNFSSKTLDIIAQAWIDSTEAPSDVQKNEHGIENLQNSLIERQKAINRALEWVSRQNKEEKDEPLNDRTQFDFKGQMCNFKIANVILSSLAEAHQRVPFDTQSNGVEDCASSILESMWSSHSTIPDAQSYALYLKCLEEETPSDVAARAQEIVNAMESGQDYNGRKLPKPDISIYSSLAQLNALSGINSSLRTSDTNPSKLHRNMYLSELSAMAHDPSTFDVDLAMKCIDQMMHFAEANADLSLQPNIEVYNAPLRWSGGPLWSRHYSRVIPWDSYSEIYQDGFKPECGIDVQRKQAEEIETWIEMMKTKASSDNSLAPNIETYESLIQAWVRCGSLESLLHAETCAKKLITSEDSGVRPRLQTFYPIIAAWTYSGCVEGPQNVESWVDLLQELEPELEPRLSFPNVPIMAQISLQRQILNRFNDPVETTSSTVTKNDIANKATTCSKILESTIDQYKASPDFLMQSDMFILVIHAWCNAAKAAFLDDGYEANEYFKEMQKTVDLFDDLLLWLYRKDTDRARSQLCNLLDYAPSVYGAQLTAIEKMERNPVKSQSKISNDFSITKHLVSIEEKIRRMEEFRLFLEGDDAGAIDEITRYSKFDYGAASAFPREAFSGNPSSCNCWADYIDLTLTVLEEGKYDSFIGEADFIRLCLLITRVTSSASPAVLSPKARERIIDKVVKLLKKYCQQNQGQEDVVTTVIQLLEKGSGTLDDKGIGGLHVTESKDENNGEFDKGGNYNPDVVNNRRKPRRRRPRGNDTHRSSHVRSNAPTNRPLRRRPHHAKIVE